MKVSLVKGFTVIELMIVIAIIGILAAVIIPGINGASNKNADGSLCKYGMKYSSGGKQIIGTNGGGIPCDEQLPKPTGFPK